jgi:DNA-binding LacI/PurR family transcriptional regulator
VPNAQITKATVGQWLRDQQLDGVILSSMPLEIMGFIRELGYRVPDQLGVALICLYGQTENFAGIDEHVDQLGESAVDAVIGMIGRNEKGLPAHPHYTLIEGSWVERPTVRALPV